MKVQMKLLSDAIFGNGNSIPGGEDISILCDEQGFPYYKGGTFKGIFREELERYFEWSGKTEQEIEDALNSLLGFSGDDAISGGKMFFSDFKLPDPVKAAILGETGGRPGTVTEAITNIRTFTAVNEEGTAKKGTLRMARCVNAGLAFEGEILCSGDDEKLVQEVLSMIKWVGTMRNRGFGKVTMEVMGKGGRA